MLLKSYVNGDNYQANLRGESEHVLFCSFCVPLCSENRFANILTQYPIAVIISSIKQR